MDSETLVGWAGAAGRRIGVGALFVVRFAALLLLVAAAIVAAPLLLGVLLAFLVIGWVWEGAAERFGWWPMRPEEEGPASGEERSGEGVEVDS